MKRVLVALMCIVALEGLAEEKSKYTKGDFSGFTINEPVIHRSKDNFVTARIKGQIYFSDDKGYPMEGALFEIKGPGVSETVRSVTTDSNGLFEFKDIPEGGKYSTFKASSLGFNAYAGMIILSRKAKARSIPRVYLQPGL